MRSGTVIRAFVLVCRLPGLVIHVFSAWIEKTAAAEARLPDIPDVDMVRPEERSHGEGRLSGFLIFLCRYYVDRRLLSRNLVLHIPLPD
jgi:hypothetical protein